MGVDARNTSGHDEIRESPLGVLGVLVVNQRIPRHPEILTGQQWVKPEGDET
jgi:hypothetical protein